MQNIKKYFMTLALLLTAVTGAWAQTAFGVKEITADMLPASWSTDESAVTADDLAKLGFMEVTEAEAQAWTGAPQKGNVRLIYTPCKSVNWVNGEGGYSTSSYSRKIFYSCLNGQRIFITTELTEWDLTPDADKKVWTLTNMPASNIELQVEYEPTKVTMAVNDNAMGTVEVAGQSKVEWTADTWKDWTADIKEYTVDDITMTSTESAHIRKYTSEDENNNSLFFFVRKQVNDATVTFSTTGDPFSRIEFTMIRDYGERNPDIIPNDNWTFEGKSAVWEGEATKSLTLQSCSTNVSKITFFKGAAIPDGVTVNGDGTFTVAETATVTLKATPAEGYKFLYWEDDQTNTNPVREVTIESGMADKTYKAVFAEITYNVTFVEGTDLNEWSATPNTEVKKGQTVTVTYTGSKKVIGVKAEKKAAEPVADIIWDVTNVSDLRVQGDFLTYEKEGVTLSGNAGNMEVNWVNFGDPTTDGISFSTNESGGFTFTAPTGKAFTKIEMKALGSYDWAQKNLGTGWAYFGDDTNKIYKVTWTGSAASTVKLLTGTDNFFGDYISSIAFYLSE